jgi:hypothetical protein
VRVCKWCRAELTATAGARDDREYCDKRCRQTAWRARKVSRMEGADGSPRRLAYADPPYPGMAKKYYGDQPDYAGEVDHRALIDELVTFDGWALSTSEKTLQLVLPLCPPGVRIAVWVKPNGVSGKTRGPHNTWEPVIYVPARLVRPGRRDWLSAKPARGGGDLPGRKPVRFCTWLLGAAPGDELVDKFPGSGVVTRSWRQAVRRHLEQATARRIV